MTLNTESNNSSVQVSQIERRRVLELAPSSAGRAPFSYVFTRKGMESPDNNAPNIVFIFDDQYRQDMSKFIETPSVDRLAREGIGFTNALSTTPLCTPFRGMLSTGRFPTHSGLVVNFVEASPIQNPNCLASVFSRAGYTTGFIGKWHLAAGFRKEEGLYEPNPEAAQNYSKRHPESEYVPPGAGRLGFKFWQAYNFSTAFNEYWFYEDAPEKIYSRKYETDTLIDQAIRYIEKHKTLDGPFLLFIAPHPPHPPFESKSLPPGYLEKIPKAEHLFSPPNVSKTNNPRKPEELRIYLAMAKNFDDNLGRLMDYLETSGIGGNTIVVFTSDHGEMHGSHGRIDKMVPYAESVNIPLIMRWPNHIPAGQVSDCLYTPVDHFATLCALAGLKTPSEIDGEDLSGVVLGRHHSYRDAVLMSNFTSHWDYFQTGTRWPEWRGVRTKRHTCVKWLVEKEELYDNLEDPYQMRNLATEHSARVLLEQLRWQMNDLMTSAHDDFLSGKEFAAWYDDKRSLIRTALGPVRH